MTDKNFHYEHTQRVGILYYLIFVAIASMFSTFYIARILPWIVPAIMVLLLLAFMLTFSALYVAVDRSHILLRFAFGRPQKSIPVDSIVEISLVQNRWFYGFGVRMTPHGWMWNVSGFDAVELTHRDGSRFRIGSDEPERLRDAIQSAIDQQTAS